LAVDSKHPLYGEFYDDWNTVRDTYRGERVIKQGGAKYLPATSGMYADGFPNPNTDGWKAYTAYRARAIFHDFVSDAIEAMIGIMHHKPPTIELPTVMEPMLESATVNGESLAVLLRRINEEQLITGRLGLLADLPTTPVQGQILPYLAMYKAERILNWDNGRREELTLQSLNFVSLDESEFERDKDFEWEYESKFRVLILGDPLKNEARGSYRQGLFREANADFSEAALIEPSIRGNKLDRIPFTFINSKDIVPDPDDPPLIGLARLVLAIYRGEADYRQSLFMQGQDTLVMIGRNEEGKVRVGANAQINVPLGGDAKFIGVESSGLSEQREALENDKAIATMKGAQMLDNRSKQVQSGDSLKIRVAARTATLNQIALAGAFGLQDALRNVARWVGADPEQVVVEPNLDFAMDELEGKTLVEYVTAKNMGFPISLESLHKIAQDKDLTDKDFEEELEAIAQEEELALGNSGPGPEPDPDPEQQPDNGQ
jgi:hypothetical protein